MNRNYSREGLLTIYQQEAKDTRDRKIIERQNRVLEERKTLDNLNNQLEMEKTEKHNIKLQRMNEMKEEYNKMMTKKDQQEFRKIRKDSQDINGTFKIGGDNRKIKRRTYDEISDSLVINPMRENLNNRGRNEEKINQLQIENINHPHIRGKSQGYNIINHSNYEHSRMGQNIYRNNERNDVPAYNSNNQSNIEDRFNNHNNHSQNQNNFDNNLNNLNNLNNFREQNHDIYENKQSEISHENNHKNSVGYNNHIPNNSHNYNGISNQNINLNNQYNQKEPDFDEAEFQRYYQEYIKKKLSEDDNKNNINTSHTFKHNDYNKILSPKEVNPYPYESHYKQHNTNEPNQNEVYKLQEINPSSHNNVNDYNQQKEPNRNSVNQLQNEMTQLNLNSHNNSEYNRNKQMNQIGYGFNHRNIQNQNYANLENELNTNKESYLSKQKIQENYRHFLDTQVKEKSIIKNFAQAYNTSYTPTQSNDISNSNPHESRGQRLNTKGASINVNPYSTKKYEFGASQLVSNPLTNPTNSYQFNYNRIRQNQMNIGPVTITNPNDRNIGSARMRQMGSNLINNI